MSSIFKKWWFFLTRVVQNIWWFSNLEYFQIFDDFLNYFYTIFGCFRYICLIFGNRVLQNFCKYSTNRYTRVLENIWWDLKLWVFKNFWHSIPIKFSTHEYCQIFEDFWWSIFTNFRHSRLFEIFDDFWNFVQALTFEFC